MCIRDSHGTSYGKCSSCHTKAVAQTACTSCHTTFTSSKVDSGPDCWTCHIPGDGPPPATDDGCRGCHGSKPHLGSSLECTSCHSLEQPTAHHDAIDQQKPTKCSDCHTTVLSHGSRDCTTCHVTSPHPNIPTTPDVCNTCHAAEVFNGRGDCVACHTAGEGFAGVSDEDIHDNAIPDAPIGGSACTCLLYTSPSPRDRTRSRMPSSA